MNSIANVELYQGLSGNAGISYRSNKDTDGEKWDLWRGNCGLRWAFHRWFSMSLDYTYGQRKDEIYIRDDYKVNRVMLSLTGSKPYKW